MNAKYSETADRLDVEYVAYLARLQLTEKEVELFGSQLGQVLAYVRELGQLDLDDVEPMAHPFSQNNVFRSDEVKPGMTRQAALDNAPMEKMDQFLVPKIVE